MLYLSQSAVIIAGTGYVLYLAHVLPDLPHVLPDFATRPSWPQIDGGKWQATQLTTDWRGESSTASLTLGNIDVINGTGLAVAHYLQQVMEAL